METPSPRCVGRGVGRVLCPRWSGDGGGGPRRLYGYAIHVRDRCREQHEVRSAAWWQELARKRFIEKRSPDPLKSSLGSGKSSTSGYGGGKSHQPLWPVFHGECGRWDEGSDI
ncbi:hypothetical protein SCLCIDRAFT_1225492 [Scleroderma citrinum Foug A]|uniref:Uncharacterized protein n=1 Tax=Scleroderma citrinum Foug A TaxID=1036808 RepID=A0A0C3CN35_9AGAM|nr:hypothetical protein SCLCIDRAFT_1225492 [Scleroderma citrinum Foug A]